MSGLGHAAGYRDLLVYKRSRELAKAIFLMSRSFPKEETYSLTDQIRRSSRSIGAQIAESWGKRRYEPHFITKLTDADGEQYETCHWIETALDCGYLDETITRDLVQRCEEIGRLLNGMIAKSAQFCQTDTRSLRETAPEYLIDEE